jgi:DGQHR domain-containing protein
MIDIIGNDELADVQGLMAEIDPSVLKAYLGIDSPSDTIPPYWLALIRDFPKERKMFAMLAAIFTHYENISEFANEYSTENMGGVFKVGSGGKHQTNLRSALVESGAALTSYRRKQEVPYSFAPIFEQSDIGKLFKQLLSDRLQKIGYEKKAVESDFYTIALDNKFEKAISLNKTQFRHWLEGKPVFQIKQFKYDLKTFENRYRKNPCIQLDQWLIEWDDIDYSLPMRRKPEDHFFLFKMDIRLLKRISDVHRRKANKPRAEEQNIQRALRETRSAEIKNFVHLGFPLSTLSDRDRNAPDNQVLKMPGFLPSAILVNIIGPGEIRGNATIQKNDLVTITREADGPIINLPAGAFSQAWEPELKPIEIIDGQHRLWAFDEAEEVKGKYEVPVIAYYNLDRAWQAYLFYVINIKPKKINTSLGYDLYPLLRTQEWLENSKDGLKVYRETRAQELVEALWNYPESPWHGRISMLGEESGNISQNAFVRALRDSYFRKGRRGRFGLFTDIILQKDQELNWVRAQQAAFMIMLWDEIAKCLHPEVTKPGEYDWVDELRNESFSPTSQERELQLDKAFISKNSNLSRDQGVTSISLLSNDFFYYLAISPAIDFNSIEWDSDIDERQISPESIDLAINKFVAHPIYTYIQYFAREIIKFDWRTSSKYRGSGGYREIYDELLQIFVTSNNNAVQKIAAMLQQN